MHLARCRQSGGVTPSVARGSVGRRARRQGHRSRRGGPQRTRGQWGRPAARWPGRVRCVAAYRRCRRRSRVPASRPTLGGGVRRRTEGMCPTRSRCQVGKFHPPQAAVHQEPRRCRPWSARPHLACLRCRSLFPFLRFEFLNSVYELSGQPNRLVGVHAVCTAARGASAPAGRRPPPRRCPRSR